jgi:hypothetical protein
MKINEIITESKQEEITEHLQLNEVDARNFDSDEDFYNAVNAPAKPRYRGQQSPGVNPDDEDYFREIFRKKREAAKKAEQDKGVSEDKVTGTFGQNHTQWPSGTKVTDEYGNRYRIVGHVGRELILQDLDSKTTRKIHPEKLQKMDSQGVAEGSTPEKFKVTYQLNNGQVKSKVMVGKDSKTVAKYFEFKYRHTPMSVENMNTVGQVDETIKKVGSQYEVVSKSGKNMGKSPTKAGAVKRLGQVEYFKHHPGK